MKRKKLELTLTIVLYFTAALMSGCFAIAILNGFKKLSPVFLKENLLVSALFPLLTAEILAMAFTLYDGRYAFQRLGIMPCAVKAIKSTVVMAGIWAGILLIEKNSITESRYYFVTVMLLNIVFLTLGLFYVQKYTIDRFHRTDSATICAILTTRERAPYITDLLKKDWSKRVEAVVLQGESIDREKSETEPEKIDHIPVVAGGEDFVSWVREHAIDEAFIYVDHLDDKLVTEAVSELEQMGIPVTMNLPSVERLEKRLDSLFDEQYTPKIEKELDYNGYVPVLTMGPPVQKMRYMALKRVMDILGGIVGCVFALVFYVFVGLAIKLDSPGPILFAQERIGKNGRKFKIYKFRSMYQDAEERKKALMAQNEMNGLMFKMKDDPRITKVGKFIRKTSIDEFPQFWNVLKGDMSLVGTRPPTVGEFKEYSNYHKRRLSMKPGITGMWQVSGRSDITDFEEVVRLDCSYIDNWSFWLDIKILIKTFAVVLKHEGAG